MQKKNTAKRQLKPTAEQKPTARILSLLYAGELDVRGGLVHRTTLYLNRLLRDTGTPQKGRPRHELYLEAVTKPGANMTYDSWVQPLARAGYRRPVPPSTPVQGAACTGARYASEVQGATCKVRAPSHGCGAASGAKAGTRHWERGTDKHAPCTMHLARCPVSLQPPFAAQPTRR